MKSFLQTLAVLLAGYVMLTRLDGFPVFVRPEHVWAITPSEEMKRARTMVRADKDFWVRESVDEVLRKLEDAGK